MKKIICLMMVLLMAISALAGCQTKEKSSTPDEGSFEATQDEAVDVATQDEAVAVATPNEVAENDDFIAPETVDVKELMADLPELNAEGFVSNYFNSSMLYYNGLLYDGRKIYDGKGNDKMYSDEHARRIAINNSVIIYALTDRSIVHRSWSFVLYGGCFAKEHQYLGSQYRRNNANRSKRKRNHEHRQKSLFQYQVRRHG